MCRAAPAKYTCPLCRRRSCSLACVQAHRQGNACAEAAAERQQQATHEAAVRTERRKQLVAAAWRAARANELPVVGVDDGRLEAERAAMPVDPSLAMATESDRVPAERLAVLETAPAVRAALANPHLSELLLDIRGSVDAVAALRAAMQVPIFVEFADACLAVCDPAAAADAAAAVAAVNSDAKPLDASVAEAAALA